MIVSAFGASGSQRSPYFQKKVARYFRKNEGTQKSSEQTQSPYFQKKVARYFRKNEGTQKSSKQTQRLRKQTSSESYESDSSSFNMIRGAPRFAKTRLGK